MEISAMISKTWINAPTVVKKNPIAHTITRITAITYNSEFMIDAALVNDFIDYTIIIKASKMFLSVQ